METLLDIDARWSQRVRVAEKPGPLRQAAIFLAHSGDSWFWGIGCLVLWLLADPAWKYRAVVIVFGIAICGKLPCPQCRVVTTTLPFWLWALNRSTSLRSCMSLSPPSW